MKQQRCHGTKRRKTYWDVDYTNSLLPKKFDKEDEKWLADSLLVIKRIEHLDIDEEGNPC